MAKRAYLCLRNIERLTDAMRLLIDNPQLREQYGSAGFKRIKLFTAETALPRFEALYHQLSEGNLKVTAFEKR